MTAQNNDAQILGRQSRRQKEKIRAFKESKSSRSLAMTGDSGLYQFQANDITSEFDPLLIGRLGNIEFSEMSKSDGVVSGFLSAYKNLILSCNWTLDEIKDITPEEQKVYDVLSNWLFKKNNFEPSLNTILRMLEHGFSCFNKYYTPFTYENNKFMMPVLLERIQKSIRRIDYEKQYIEQITSRNSLVEIDFKDLVFFTFRKEGEDLRGVSLLRQAYYAYKDKKEVSQVAKKGIFREMLGLPTVKVPPSVHVDSPEYQALEELMDSVSSRDSADVDDSLIIPNTYELDFWNGDFKISEIITFLNYYDSQMAISVLAQFILLGQQGKGGSYSLGSDQSNFFMDGLQFIVDYIEDQYTKEVIEPSIKSNWANVDATKFRLRGLNLNKQASKEFAEIIKLWIDSGLLKVQIEDEKQIREMYGLSEINEKERAKQENEKQNAPVPPIDPNAPKAEDVPPDDEEPEDVEEGIEENSLQSCGCGDCSPEIELSTNEVEIVEFWKTGKQRDQYLEDQVKSLTKFSKASLQIIADKLIAAMRWQMKKNPTNLAKGLKDIKLNQNAVASYKRNMGQKLSEITLKSWNVSKEKAAPHLKALMATNPGDLPTKALTSFILNQTELSLDKQLTNMKDLALLSANTATTKGYGLEQTLAQVDDNMDSFIDNANQVELANFTSVSQAVSYGQLQYYKSIEDNIWGYRFENVSPKTQLCSNLVGKVYRNGSSAMEQISPPLHFRCKSYFEPIYKDLEKPVYDDYIPPPSILKEKTM
jgi:phage gp29-like protein